QAARGALGQEIEQLRRSQEERENASQQAAAALEALRVQLAEQAARRDELTREIETLRAAQAQRETSSDDTSSEVEALRAQLAEQQAIRDALAREIEERRAQRVTLSAELPASEATPAVAQDLAAAEALISELQETLSAKEQEMAKWREQAA